MKETPAYNRRKWKQKTSMGVAMVITEDVVDRTTAISVVRVEGVNGRESTVARYIE